MSGPFDRLNAACVRHFAEVVVYTPAGGGTKVINGIPSSGIREGSEFPATFVRLFVTNEDLAAAGLAPAKGDSAVILGKARRVVEVLEDAAGGVTICFGP